MYQALYRKYRPQSFSEVVGQQNVVKTLKNQINENHISHAYLFTGSRGTGKTSCAKILAKAVNCLSPKNGDPCNECEICRGINDESIFDVTEIDAASNNGVDNIRELRDNTAFSPAAAKYRIYIIDEVHMLSGSAFNALLKTLEEPPAHVIFILATTEVHKLPATILSRCQRFDFNRISPDDIAARLSEVAQKEGISLTGDAALMIAKLSDGAMRDALSLLDVCAASGDEVTEQAVLDAAGLSGREYLERLAAAIAERDSEQALTVIGELYERSKDLTRLCSELIDYFRNLMLARALKKPEQLLVCPAAEIEKLKEQSKKMPLDTVLHAIETLESAYIDMNRGSNRRTIFETAMMRLCDPSVDISSAALLRRISALESGAAVINAERAAMPKSNPSPTKNDADALAGQPTAEPNDDAEDEQVKIYQKRVTADDIQVPSKADSDLAATVAFTPVGSRTQESDDVPYRNWNDILGELGKTDMMMKAALDGSSAYIVGDCMLIDFKNESFRNMINTSPRHKAALKNAIVAVTGRSYKIGPYSRRNMLAQQQQQDDDPDPLDIIMDRAKKAGIADE